MADCNALLPLDLSAYECSHLSVHILVAPGSRCLIFMYDQRTSQVKAIEKEVMEIVERSVEFADNSPAPEPSQLLENVFADPK